MNRTELAKFIYASAKLLLFWLKAPINDIQVGIIIWSAAVVQFPGPRSEKIESEMLMFISAVQ